MDGCVTFARAARGGGGGGRGIAVWTGKTKAEAGRTFTVQRGQCAHLPDGRGVDEGVLLQFVERLDEVTGDHRPPHAPPGHAVVFGEGVDDEGRVGVLDRRGLRTAHTRGGAAADSG